MSKTVGSTSTVAVRDSQIGDRTAIAQFATIEDCHIGVDCRIWRYTNLYGCEIGDESMIGTFVEIQADAVVGDRCRIQSHAFVCSRVELGDDVFVSHGAKFINDTHPPSGDESAWEPTRVDDGASIGTNATILPVEIGENALVGAGAVVTEDVPADAIVAGNPAEIIGYRDERAE